MSFINAQETRIFMIVGSIRDLWLGRSNAVGEFTLADGETETVVTAKNCGPMSRIALTPRTENAATALASLYIPADTVVNGQFTVKHDSTADLDRTFGYAING